MMKLLDPIREIAAALKAILTELREIRTTLNIIRDKYGRP